MADRFGQLRQWSRSGVSPRGAQVLHAVGSSKKPLSSTKTSVAFSFCAFFLAGARCVGSSTGWPARRARARDRWATASSSRSDATGGRHDRGQSAPESVARSTGPRAGWSRRARASRRLRPRAPADAEAVPVVREPAWVGVRAAVGGATPPARAAASVVPTTARLAR